MKAIDYYNKGFQHAKLCTVVAWGGCDSWQRKAFKRGYIAGNIYMQGEALLNGYDNVFEYRTALIKEAVK